MSVLTRTPVNSSQVTRFSEQFAGRSRPVLLICLDLAGVSWGQGCLRVCLHPNEESTAPEFRIVSLSSPCNTSGSGGQCNSTCKCGELLLTTEWSPDGVRLKFHSVRSLSVPPARLGCLADAQLSGSVAIHSLVGTWGLQILAVGFGGLTEPLPLCALRATSRSTALTESELTLERTVEIRWPSETCVTEVRLQCPTCVAKHAEEQRTARASADTTAAPAAAAAAAAATSPTAVAAPVAQQEMEFKTEQDVEAAITTPQASAMRTTDRFRWAMIGGEGSKASARSLQGWAASGNWFFFSPHYCRYDDQLLPIDETTALNPAGNYCLSPADLAELRADSQYLQCHGRVACMVLLSWGWDAEMDRPAEMCDENAGQGWHQSGAPWRLRHLCLSLWLLGQSQLRERAKHFALSLGSSAPWDEDGFSEATFTLQRKQHGASVAQRFWADRPRRHCHETTSRNRRLRDIVVSADIRCLNQNIRSSSAENPDQQ